MDKISYTTYIIESQKSGMIYIGHTQDMDDRINRHNTNRNRFTRGRAIFTKSFATRKEAITLERKLKSFKNKAYLLQWIQRNYGLEHPDLPSGGS